jgi:hypothetical protein
MASKDEDNGEGKYKRFTHRRIDKLMRDVEHLQFARLDICRAGSSAELAKLLHHDPAALDFVQIELNRCGRLGRRHIGRLDRTEDFPLAAKQDNAPAPLHPAGELGGAVFLTGSAGRHGENIAPALPWIEYTR